MGRQGPDIGGYVMITPRPRAASLALCAHSHDAMLENVTLAKLAAKFTQVAIVEEPVEWCNSRRSARTTKRGTS